MSASGPESEPEPRPLSELIVSGEEKMTNADTDRLNQETHQTYDSDEEIFGSRKVKGRKPLENSDSEGENTHVKKDNYSTSDGESEVDQRNLNINTVDKSKKLRRIQRLMSDSGESDEDDLPNPNGAKSSPIGNTGKTAAESIQSDSDSSVRPQNNSKGQDNQAKGKGKSQRWRERNKNKLAALEKLKKKKEKKQKKQEELTTSKTLNDSGCLFVDNDLFETEMDQLPQVGGDDEEEESLEAIRAAVKKKAKQSKRMSPVPSDENLFDDDDDDSNEKTVKKCQKKIRVERKAAKQSKEAMRQIHSETQRLMREASHSVPYHVPEPKTIHDFFKKRSRPVCNGNALALLKSVKYESYLLQETSDSTPAEPKALVACPQGDRQLSNNDRCSATEQPHSDNPYDKGDACPDLCTDEGQIENKQTAETIEHLGLSTVLSSEDKDGEINEETTNSFHLELTEDLETDSSEKLTVVPAVDSCVEIRDKTEPDAAVKLVNDVNIVSNLENCIKPPETLEAPPVSEQQKSKLDKLRELGVDLTLKPRLCADAGAFVNLEEPKENKALEALKERFLKHAIKPCKPKQERRVELSIIRKEITADGKEELKADSVSVTLGTNEMEELGPTKPGEKLQVLKAKLQKAMKQRRMEERQKRQELYKIDNEQGFEEEEEEEEEEMTDESESDGENTETVEFLFGDEEAEVESDGLEEEDGDSSSASIDRPQNQNSAIKRDSTPKPQMTESLQLFKSDTTSCSKMSDQHAGDKSLMQLQHTPPKRKLDEDDSVSQASTTKENSHNSSFELVGSMIPSYQPISKQPGRFGGAMMGGFRSPSPSLFNPNSVFKTSFISSTSKSSGKLSEPSLPVEDSQDLYNASPELKNSLAGSQFRFSLEDETQSQLLDADGFLNVGQRSNKWQPSKRQLMLDSMDENAMDANMGELLGLCSGQFKSQSSGAPKENHKEQEENLDELLGLCSGKFVSQGESSFSSSSVAEKQPKTVSTQSDGDPMTEVLALCSGSFPTDREDELEEEEDDQFQLLTDDEVFKSEDEKSSDGEEDGGEEEAEEEDDEEIQMARELRMKRKMKLRDFVEEEAALSGSEASADEDDAGDYDEYEEEVIDEVLPSDEELQQQVNKIHMKAVLDDDKRQLRLFKERYLADGDLHTDGPGRTRRFRWKTIDDSSQADLFPGDSDEEEKEEIDETEMKWRKERFEREQWLREQSNAADSEKEEEIDEDSQFMKLAKKITVKALQKKGDLADAGQEKNTGPMVCQPLKTPSCRLMKNGSLLNRPKEVLRKLAAISEVNLNAPRANSRNFVFHTLSPEKKAEKVESRPEAKRKTAAVAIAPLAKRPRIEKPTTNSSQMRSSIFRYLEK
ncbi:claspin [Callorhinchus milii]|uniref:claspin n=1 Tax=Callorhinchus milii TaxID=7868 RepID=UPI001C3FA666|nr:claspin [Callorhinchus milii]